jgi:hypothetical protein
MSPTPQQHHRSNAALLLAAFAVLISLPLWASITLLVLGLVIKFGPRVIQAYQRDTEDPPTPTRRHEDAR